MYNSSCRGKYEMKIFSQANNLCRFTSFLYRLINCFILSLLAAASTHAAMPDAGHGIQPGIIYHRTGDEVLTGDLYRPKKNGKHPVLIAVHGGDWRFADASLYKHWGPYLAMNGYAVLAVNYRLVKDKTNLYRSAVHEGVHRYLWQL